MGKQGEFVSLDPAFHFLLSVQYVSWFLYFQMALCEPAVSCGVSSSYVVPSSWFYSFDIIILSGFFYYRYGDCHFLYSFFFPVSSFIFTFVVNKIKGYCFTVVCINSSIFLCSILV